MAKSKINSTIRKSVEGTLNFENAENLTIEIEDIGEVSIKNLFEKFDGEHGKLVFTVSNDE